MSKETNDKEKRKPNELITGAVDAATSAGKKGIHIATGMLTQAANSGKVIADGLAKGRKELAEKAKEDSYAKRLKKYNPLFPDEYFSADFYVPNIIMIVDDAVRRDINVCQGAIGWRENVKGTEVLFIYDEFVAECGLKFIPVAACDEIYYVDTFDKQCFVKLDYIFQKTHEEKLAELEHIAYCLGAKNCSIRIIEKEIIHDKKNKILELKGKKNAVAVTEGGEIESVNDSSQQRAGKSDIHFKGNDSVVMPKLKWFQNDNIILNLIEYRSNKGNEITTRTLELKGASSTTMSRRAAYNIDMAVAGMGVNQSYSMEERSVKESESQILYYLEF